MLNRFLGNINNRQLFLVVINFQLFALIGLGESNTYASKRVHDTINMYVVTVDYCTAGNSPTACLPQILLQYRRIEAVSGVYDPPAVL